MSKTYLILSWDLRKYEPKLARATIFNLLSDRKLSSESLVFQRINRIDSADFSQTILNDSERVPALIVLNAPLNFAPAKR